MTYDEPGSGDHQSPNDVPEITILSKDNGTISKTISIVDGKLVSDGSSCIMGSGSARRQPLANGAASLAKVINALGSREALALGRLESTLPCRVRISTKAKLPADAPANTITRTRANIAYELGLPAFALIDIDLKGVPNLVAEHASVMGGYDELLTYLFPYLADVARVSRPSTSACVVNSETGEPCHESGGRHLYLLVADGADIERFLAVLHDRLWLAGYGWFVLGATGQLLERSLIDRTVWGPERLVFEAPPTLIAPAVQDPLARVPQATGSNILDSRRMVQDLSPDEQVQADALKRAARQVLEPEAAKLQSSSDRALAKRLSENGNGSEETCLRRIGRRHAGELTSTIPLEFDDPNLGRVSVGDILRDPIRYTDETLADPLEGASYGRCKAKVMPGSNGWPFIHSFAHGRQIYDLRHDASSLRIALEGVRPESLCDRFISLLERSSLADDELSTLCTSVATQSGSGLLAVKSRVKAELQRLAAERSKKLRATAPDGARVVLDAPATNGEFTPVLLELDRILSAGSIEPEPMRNAKGELVVLQEVPPDGLHLLSSATSSSEVTLPAAPEPLIVPMSTADATLFVERHIEYQRQAPEGIRSVRLPQPYVDAYRSWTDSRISTVRAVVTAPLVSHGGALLMKCGLDRSSGILYKIDPRLREVIPAQTVTGEQAHAAWCFLTDQWLCDVAADYVGKGVAVAYALTLIERVLLPERPAFFFTAAQRAAGKTTLANMLATAVLGRGAPAAAWAESVEERRKALMSMMRAGVATVVWDNIRRGSLLTCPHIEALLTSSTYSDRILGSTLIETVSSQTVLVFTGNNILPKGDLASRSLVVSLNVDRPDPENRSYHHQDPVQWTLVNRGQILNALYTLLLWRRPSEAGRDAPTRFKSWWALIGRPIEEAIGLTGHSLSFGKLFAAVEETDEEADGTARCYRLLKSAFATEAFTAAEVTDSIVGNGFDDLSCKSALTSERFGAELKAAIADASGSPFRPGPITAQQVAKKLQRFVDRPAILNDAIFRLHRTTDRQRGNRYELRAVGCSE